jgi:hypothetical protein
MTSEELKERTLEGFERMFNQATSTTSITRSHRAPSTTKSQTELTSPPTSKT